MLNGLFLHSTSHWHAARYTPSVMKPSASIIRKKPSTWGEEHQASVLLVGTCPAKRNHRDIRIVTPDEGLETLRVLQFDLVLIATNTPDESTWEFAASLRRFWPWQRWAFLSPNPTDDDQRRAYELGACAIFDSLPPPDQLKRIAGIGSSKISFQPDTT
jgi:CheY-like chemotaxis protein